MSAYLTAYEHFNEHRSILKMTTGSANLDSLIDSIQEGQFYLFYGSNKAVLDGLVQGLLVNCVLPKQKHGFESMALYNIDYYQPDKSKVLTREDSNSGKMCWYRIEVVFKNLFAQIPYNQSQSKKDIRLLVIKEQELCCKH